MPIITTKLVDVYLYRLIQAKPEFLLLRRAPTVKYAGQWRMIGGKIEPKETAWQAALRETKEETGALPTAFWALPSLNHFYQPSTDEIHLIPAFAGLFEHTPLLNHEHDSFQWFSFEEAQEVLHWYEQKRLLALTYELLTQKQILPDWYIPFP